MQIPQPAFWALFVLVIVFMLVALAFMLLRGERIGSLECPLVYGTTLARARFTVVREGRGGGKSGVQVRLRIPMTWTLLPLEPGQAIRLAEHMETAAARLRAP
jgi:hypothetical protein